MSDNTSSSPIQIKKYPNRRYYDANHSRHITLQEVHDLIVSGKDVCVTDSRTGEDITNAVLMQILLERDQPKLDLFPSSILHMMIRSNRQVLRETVERFFGPFLGIMAASQKQFDAYLRQTMQGRLMSPFDWAGQVMRAFGGGPGQSTGSRNGSVGETHEDAPADAGDPADPAILRDLRSQIDSLRRRVEELDAGGKDKRD